MDKGARQAGNDLESKAIFPFTENPKTLPTRHTLVGYNNKYY